VTTIEAPTGHRSLLRHAVATSALALALAGLAEWGRTPLALGVGVLQVLLVLGFLALVDAPAAGGVFLLGTAATVAADVIVHVDAGRVAGLSGVAGLALVATLLLQLVRKNRIRVTESIADSLVVVVLVCSAACLPAALHHDPTVVRAGVLAAGAALLVSRLDGLWGLLLALALGAGTGLLAGRDGLGTRDAALVGLVAAGAVATADLLVDLARGDLHAQPRDQRRIASLQPVGLLLPFALLGPVLFVAIRLLES
jgi:hypothetical protein